MNKNKGLYLGSEIDKKWWKRYTKDKFLIQGNGEYWYDEGSYLFGYLIKNQSLLLDSGTGIIYNKKI